MSTAVAHTVVSGQHPAGSDSPFLSSTNGSSMPTSDSAVGLLSAEAEVHQINEQPELSSSSSDDNSGGEAEVFNANGPLERSSENLVRVKVGHIRRRAASGKAPLASTEGLENPVSVNEESGANSFDVRV